MPAFDFHTLSLTIDSTFEEYDSATGVSQGATILGLNIADVLRGDRSKFLRFRHEHAHFTSFVGSGLVDLYGVLSDYLSLLCYVVLREEVKESPETLWVPVYDARRPDHAALHSAYQQLNAVRALLFGFGSRTPLGAILDSAVQDAFWQRRYESRFQLMVGRYYDLLRRLAGAPHPMTEGEASGPSQPSVSVGGKQRPLSARAVMEAYAITIELAATHLRKVESNLTHYGSPTARQPGPLYTVALQHVLEHLRWPEPVSLEAFLTGRAPLECYYVVPVLTFAAMQVPVLQILEGDYLVWGDRRNLSVAHAFDLIVAGIEDGALAAPPPNLRNSENADQELLDWLGTCRSRLGDDSTMQIYTEVQKAFERDERLKAMSATSQTISELVWAGRANFLREPAEYVLDAGLFAEAYPCQPRFVRTADNRVIGLADDGNSGLLQARYVSEQAVPILEAAVFGEQWESVWAKLPEVAQEDRPGLVQAAIFAIAAQFDDLDAIGDPPPVQVSPSL